MSRDFQRIRKYESRKEVAPVAIFANGEQTEKNYFRSLCVDLKLIGVRGKPDTVYVKGKEHNTKSLVEFAVKNKDEYQEVWVVIDRDDQDKLFDEAISLARSNDIKIAYSVECFEFWFLLHFNYYQTSMRRAEYYKMLTDLLSFKYEKHLDIYKKIKSNEDEAIRRAEKLEKQHNDSGITIFHKRNPSTTVHLLVKRLHELAAKRS